MENRQQGWTVLIKQNRQFLQQCLTNQTYCFCPGASSTELKTFKKSLLSQVTICISLFYLTLGGHSALDVSGRSIWAMYLEF
jgi:hypothetical protein